MSRKSNDRRKKLDFAITADNCFIPTNHKRRVIKGDYETTRITRNGKDMLLHRWVYEEMFGEIPDGMVILHSCDNSLCINPEHLSAGTQKENVHDMINKGRSGLIKFVKTKGENENGETM